MRNKWRLVVLWMGLGLLSTIIARGEAEMTPAQCRAFVEKAAALVEKEGADCFTKFRKKGGPWFEGSQYVFVWSADAIRLCFPPDPEKEGMDVADLKDINGRPIGKLILGASKTEAGSWIHYMYNRPGKLFPTLKSTFVKKAIGPEGTAYIVGSGYYSTKVNKIFIEDMVDKGAKLMEEEGDGAFSTFADPAGPYVFGTAYIFVYNMDGVCLFNYNTPSLAGKNLLNFQDPKGKYLIQAFIEETKNKPTAWVDYMWPKPKEGDAFFQKSAYVRKVKTPDGERIIGSGIYLD